MITIKKTRLCNPLLSLHMLTIPLLVYGIGKLNCVTYNHQYEFVWWILIPVLFIVWFLFNFKFSLKTKEEKSVDYSGYFYSIDRARSMEIEIERKNQEHEISPASLVFLGWKEILDPFTGKNQWVKTEKKHHISTDLPSYLFYYRIDELEFIYNGGEFSHIKIRITSLKDLEDITRILSSNLS
jgi:hypothetical protein